MTGSDKFIQEDTRKVQEDIYHILSALYQQQPFSTLYHEGSSRLTKHYSFLMESCRLISGLKEDIGNKLSEKRNEKQTSDTSSSLSEAYKKVSEMERRAYALLHVEAPARFAASYPVELVGVDSAELMQDSVESGPVESFERADKREDAVLSRVAQDEDILKICVYGAGHLFGGAESSGAHYRKGVSLEDNIAGWNNSNPSKKFSLIEITPSSFDIAKYQDLAVRINKLMEELERVQQD
jgi:hypothetical protein